MKFLKLNSSPVDVGEIPEEIKILPIGLVKSRKGNFIVDDESVKLIKEHFSERKIDLVIDYEHQTLNGSEAPAGGWISEIYTDDEAVVAKVKWTDRAKEYLKNKEYRYLSPVVMVRKSDGKAVSIHSVALTNTPAIDGMFPVVNSLGEYEDDIEEIKEETMDLKELAKLIGIDETATEEDVRKKIAELVEIAEKALEDKPVAVANSVVLSLLGLDEKAKTEDAVAAIMSFRTQAADEETKRLRAELHERDTNDLVQEALKAGKISAAQKDWAKAYALSDNVGFKKFLDIAPSVVPMGKVEAVEAKKSAETKDEMEKKILKACGISEEDIEKYGAKEDR